MNGLMQRRRMLLQAVRSVIDTSPVVDVYGYNLGRSDTGTVENEAWCYTVWMTLDPAMTGTVGVCDNCTDSNHTYQILFDNDSRNWFYRNTNNADGQRNLNSTGKYLIQIRCSIKIADIDNSWMFIRQSGEILFAGKNTIYYGHKNISELS